MSYRLLASSLLALAGLGIVAGPVAAADLDPAYGLIPPQQERVEFGTGWYVRGDISVTQIPKANLTSTSPSTTTSVFVDNAPTVSFSPTQHIGYTASLGGGYSFNKWFRADAIFDFHQPIGSAFNGAPFACQNGFGLTPSSSTTTTQNDVATTVSTPASSYQTYGTCTGQYKASLNSYDALINGYVDLGTWYGITPYIGGGVGLSFGHYQTSSTYTQADNTAYNLTISDPVSGQSYHINYDRSASGQYYNFAFALMAGVSYDLSEHAKFDVGYRYIHLGQVLGTNLYTNEVRAGLRYMIDN